MLTLGWLIRGFVPAAALAALVTGCVALVDEDPASREGSRDSRSTEQPLTPRGGVSLPPYKPAPLNVNEGETLLGVIQGGLALEVDAVDDTLSVTVNGSTALRVGFGQRGVYDISPHLRPGPGWNTISLRVDDDQNGQCWGVRYRIGDDNGWRAADGYTRCVWGTQGSNPVYTRSFTVYVLR